jgi:hypothetical protein
LRLSLPGRADRGGEGAEGSSDLIEAAGILSERRTGHQDDPHQERDLLLGRLGDEFAVAHGLIDRIAQASIASPIDALEAMLGGGTENRKIVTQARQRAPHVAGAVAGIEPLVEAPQIRELRLQPIEETEAGISSSISWRLLPK